MLFRNTISPTDGQRAEVARWLGDAASNAAADPPNMKPCTAGQVFHMLSSYTPTFEVSLGYARRADGKWSSRIAYVFGDGFSNARGGYVIEWVNDYGREIPGDYPVNYYTWAQCDHTYASQKLGNCYHRYTCSKCGAAYEVDSSD